MKKSIGLVAFFLAAVSLAASGGEHHDEGHIPLEQIGWQAANLGILLTALFFFLKKSMVEAFANRRSDFIAQSEKTKSSLKEAETALSDIKERLAKLESGEKSALSTAQHEATVLAANIVKDAEALSEKMKKDAELTIKNELEKAKREINEAILNQALGTSKKALADKTQNASDDLEKSFVNQLGQVRA